MSAREKQNLFTGRIGEEYELLRILCPNAALLAAKLGEEVAAWRKGEPLVGLEIGCGTGISTLALLEARPELKLAAIDSAAAMLDQARENLADDVRDGRVEFIEADALDYLKRQKAASVSVVASNYAIHNFAQDYRRAVLAEIFRVLEPGGLFVNGDRYAIDDPAEHLALTQSTLRHWFRIFGEMQRHDLLEDWVVHLASDESTHHIMPLAPALEDMRRLGFSKIEIMFREGVDTLLRARKPA